MKARSGIAGLTFALMAFGPPPIKQLESVQQAPPKSWIPEEKPKDPPMVLTITPPCDADPKPTEAFVTGYNEMKHLLARGDYAAARERFAALELLAKGPSQISAIIGMKLIMHNGLGDKAAAIALLERALETGCLAPGSRTNFESTLRKLRDGPSVGPRP